MLARRRSYLFLGGALSSALSLMLVFRLGTWLMGSGRALAFQAELYLGLLIFVGYVLFDTQVMHSEEKSGLPICRNHCNLFAPVALSVHHSILRMLAQSEARTALLLLVPPVMSPVQA